MTNAGYRSSHSAVGSGHRYDLLFASDRYDGWIWSREQLALRAIIQRYFPGGSFRLLDFACGTGRILSFLERWASEAVGIDVSPEMLRRAHGRVHRSTLLQADITRAPLPFDGAFDLVTAFRFFLNAEESLRAQALAALYAVLRPGGVLVVNVHGNSWSLKLPSYLYRRWVLRQSINVLSRGAMVRLLLEAGFRVEAIVGVGWCSPRIFSAIGPRRADRLEELGLRVPWFGRFATHLIYVCTK